MWLIGMWLVPKVRHLQDVEGRFVWAVGGKPRDVLARAKQPSF